MIPFLFNENRFPFFWCRPSTGWPVVYKYHEQWETSTRSESDTMFGDRRCAAVQLMFSTDPSYDNSTIANTLKMHRWIATSNREMPRVMKKFPATVMAFGVVSIMPPHIFEVSLKVNIKVYLDVLKSVVIPWYNQVAVGRHWALARSSYLSFFSHSFSFILWWAGTAKSTILQVLFFFCWLLLSLVFWPRFGDLYVCRSLIGVYVCHYLGQVLGCVYTINSCGQI